MKIGLVGLPGSGKSTVFGALTGQSVETGYAARPGKAQLGTVKVPDPRVDAMAALYRPKKTTYAEIVFTDLGARSEKGIDRAALNAMREVDALCQVVRAFPDASGAPPDALGEIGELETETVLADLEIVENRLARLRKERGEARDVALFERIRQELESGRALRAVAFDAEELRRLSGFGFLSLMPLLLVLNVAEADLAAPPHPEISAAAEERGLGLVVLSAQVEMEIAQMQEGDQAEFLASLGLEEPTRNRFIRAAYQLIDLISMLTVGPDECRAWPLQRGTAAPRAAGKIHSDIERGFIRAEVVRWDELAELGSEARCREAGKLRVEGKEYVVQDGDVINFRFNV